MVCAGQLIPIQNGWQIPFSHFCGLSTDMEAKPHFLHLMDLFAKVVSDCRFSKVHIFIIDLPILYKVYEHYCFSKMANFNTIPLSFIFVNSYKVLKTVLRSFQEASIRLTNP